MMGHQEQLPQILVLGPPSVFKPYEHQFTKKFQILKPWESSLPTHLFLSTHGGSVEAVLTSGIFPVTANGVLNHLPALRLIVTTSAGLNHIDLPECRRRGISVANAAEIFSEDVADLGVGLLTDVMRRVSAGDGSNLKIDGSIPPKSSTPSKSSTKMDREKLSSPPQVLMLRPPPVFLRFQPQFSEKFQFLRAWESDLPLDAFLSNHAQHVQAMLTHGGGLPITADQVLRHLPSLRLIVTTSAGFNHIDLLECRRRGISVANAGTIFSEDAADMAVALFIDVHRRLSAADRCVRGANWPITRYYPLGSKVSGKRIGIVGLGSIGYEVAKRLDAFGCRISYNSRQEKPSVPYQFYSNVCELAANSDALIICCALTDETRHMINRKVMLALGKDGVIVNIARGALIDEKEMIKCLMNGEIAGAGLDVFEYEPNVPKELREMDNVVLTPHVAVFTDESFWDLFQLMVGNLEAFFSKKPLLTPVLDD
ncbi:D-isomer specific 2-hydroxyacid dehydrogenase, NAD-binding domain [Dillenia turbinata]|uniref:D-isomer specific 2-hydroxyacid dehydrogenase, NAD-binding domain n=1 Tax=Dillenia turbinata TaxID=194707 RepID=A0AAN8UQ70_9MAGN